MVLGKRHSDPVSDLAAVVIEERDRIARLWAKRLKLELNELEARSQDIREPLSWMVGELGRLLRDRGEDAVRLWPEVIRSHGAARYDLRYEPEDVAHELKSLHQVLIRVYSRARGGIDPDVAELLAELMGEANAAVQSSWARVLRTEEVRLREAAVMESLLEHIDVGILLAEEDGRLSWATPPVTRLVGLPARVFVGAGLDAMRSVLVQLNARHLNGSPFRASDVPYVRALKEKREFRGVTMAIDHHPDGREVILEMTAIPVWEEGTDELYGVVQTLVDRTETIHKSWELSQAYEQLRRLQGRLLQKTRTQALGQLASGAAHSLNNFLNVIRLRLTLLRREYKPQYLDALDKTVNNVSELVARLQDFSSQRAEEEVSDVPVNQVVQESLDLVRVQLEQPEAVVEVKLELEDAPLVRADVSSLRELFVNLVLSARARMPKGGVLTIHSRTEGSWLNLDMQDSGPAYSQDELTRLFDPLKGRSPAPHLSLLLAVGRNQVQRWGGELWAENIGDGVGARFHMRLPLAVPQERPLPQRVAPPTRPTGRRLQPRRVMVVDDEPENARMLAEVLREEGYDVGVAHSGKDALALWEHGRFEAALLDALMPDMSGWAIAREIRSRSPTALIAVVTGGDVRGQNRANLALVDAVFRKPVDVGALDDFLAQPEPLPAKPAGEPEPEEAEENPPIH